MQFSFGRRILNHKTLGGVELCRPNNVARMKIRYEAENHLRQQFEIGTYHDPKQINTILQHQILFLETKLERALQGLASYGFLEFILFQYDQAALVERSFKSGSLSGSDRDYWQEEGKIIRRSLKFIAERCVSLNPPESATCKEEEYVDRFDTICTCAEVLVNLSVLSDQTYYLFPKNSILKILPEGEQFYYSLDLDTPGLLEESTAEYDSRVRRDRQRRNKVMKETQFDLNIEEQAKYLDPGFQDLCGLSLREVVDVLVMVLEMSKPHPDRFPICCIPLSAIYEGLRVNCGISKSAAETILSGFLLTPENLQMEARHFWNPKNRYRAYRRGIFQITRSDEKHLIWSDAMYKECFMVYRSGFAFGILPDEWIYSKRLVSAAGDLSVARGKWFEGKVLRILKKLGFLTISNRDSFGFPPNNISCPHGEIDILAYKPSDRLLFFGECKMVLSGSEPKLFKDELKDFVGDNNSFSEKHKKKVDWAKDNLDELLKALSSTGEIKADIQPKSLVSGIVTFYPSYASRFIDEFPCVSLTEFYYDLRNSRGRWPYKSGIAWCEAQ